MNEIIPFFCLKTLFMLKKGNSPLENMLLGVLSPELKSKDLVARFLSEVFEKDNDYKESLMAVIMGVDIFMDDIPKGTPVLIDKEDPGFWYNREDHEYQIVRDNFFKGVILEKDCTRGRCFVEVKLNNDECSREHVKIKKLYYEDTSNSNIICFSSFNPSKG